MGFFDRSADEDPEQVESRRRIEEGGIPPSAHERLRQLGSGGSLYTSGLSVKEFALLDGLRSAPLAQVMGASVVRTGWQYLPALPPGVVTNSGPWYSPMNTRGSWLPTVTEPSPAQVRAYRWRAPVVCELDTLTDAWNLARRRALDRLTEEALQVGADAVVGVTVHRSDHDFGSGVIDYAVRGTAVRFPGSDGTKWPLLTDVSVQDLWRLGAAGQEPVGLLATTSVVFASPARATRLARLRTTARNQELDEVTEAFHAVRTAVRARLQGQVSDAHATGAVGVSLEHSVHRETIALASSVQSSISRGWHTGRLGIPYFVSGHSDVERRGWVITMHAAGTAIRRRPGARAPASPTSLRIGLQ